jgi:hypothetical protein
MISVLDTAVHQVNAGVAHGCCLQLSAGRVLSAPALSVGLAQWPAGTRIGAGG